MFEKPSTREVFKKPDIQAEKGEFERVGQLFGIDDSVLMYLAQAEGSMVPLTDDLWSTLSNSDSFDIPVEGHDVAERLAQSNGRDYHAVADRMYAGLVSGEALDAPIIMKHGNQYHVVSGNTRLMAARAYGVTPPVWLFEVDSHEA